MLKTLIYRLNFYKNNFVELKIFGEILNGSNVKVRAEPFESKTMYGDYKGFNLVAVMLLDEVPKLFV